MFQKNFHRQSVEEVDCSEWDGEESLQEAEDGRDHHSGGHRGQGRGRERLEGKYELGTALAAFSTPCYNLQLNCCSSESI